MNLTYILTLILFAPAIVFSQTYKGLIIDSLTNKNLPYVNIGISNKNIGTVSDTRGNFNITIPGNNSTDTLVFSMIGYKTKRVKVSDLKNNMTILLNPMIYEIPEIQVLSFSKTKKVGNRTENHRYVAGFNNYQLGSEIGSLINISRKSRIKTITFSVAQCKPDSITFRLNIYSTKINSYPDRSLVQKPFYFTLKKENSNSTVSVNIAYLNIVVDNDIVVAIECLEDVALHAVSFSALMYNGKFFVRKASQHTWEKYPVGVGITAEIEYN